MYLGFEMKLIGEVMGSDYYLEKVLYKVFEVFGLYLLSYGVVFFIIVDEIKEEVLEIVKCFLVIGYSLVVMEGIVDFLVKY